MALVFGGKLLVAALVLCVHVGQTTSTHVVAMASMSGSAADDRPIAQVLKLLHEMQKRVEAEADEDAVVYGKMHCWCETNDREKTAAIKSAEQRVSELALSIEAGSALATQLGTEIASLKADIEAANHALKTASALREKEHEAFQAEDADHQDALAALSEAIAVLEKVQLLQHGAVRQVPLVATRSAEEQSLAQVRRIVARAPALRGGSWSAWSPVGGLYRSVMQKDLWAVLGAFPGSVGATGLLEQPTGAAAGATSYKAQSSSVLGMLKEMKAQFERDSATAREAERLLDVAYQKLRVAKEAEVRTSSTSVEEKSARFADTNQKVAQAKQDIDDTRGSLSADDKFLMDLKKRCTSAKDEYGVREVTRREEIAAISEAIHILSQDDARDFFSRTISFIQVRGGRSTSAMTANSRARRARVAQMLLAKAASRGKRAHSQSGGRNLAELAISVQLDDFTKVKEVMDKMVVVLKKQQKDEYERSETCKANLSTNENMARAKDSDKKDLEADIAGHEGTLHALDQDLAELHKEVDSIRVSLQSATEQRKEENHEFQEVVANQRATVSILKKALQRLQQFYYEAALAQKAPGTTKSLQTRNSFLAVRSSARQHREEIREEPAPAPAAGKAYAASGGAAGVMQMLAKIIQDAESMDHEAVAAEAASQAGYEQLVQNTNGMLAAAESAIAEKTVVRSQVEADRLMVGGALTSTSAELDSLAEQAIALHLQCDYLLKSFDIRQQARQDELDAIAGAKAILSGASLGAAEA